MDKRLKKFVFKPQELPFPKEESAAKAYKKLFSEGLGLKVLEQLILEMEYFRPDLPVSHEQMAFNAGKKYVINHILHAVNAVYETIEIEEDEYGNSSSDS